MDSSNTRRRKIHSQGRQMIARVYHFLKEEYEFTKCHQEPNCDITHLRGITKRTAEATGVSVGTVQTVLKEERDIKRNKRENKTVERADHQSGIDCDSNLSAAHGSTQNAGQDPDISDSDSLLSEPSIHVKSQRHNIICNECKGQIIGFRYVCVQCADFDMCSECETRAAHSQHYVLRLPGPRPQKKVKSLITAIQEQLKTFFDTAIKMDPLVEEIKIEYDIKEEPTDVDDDSIVPQQSEFIQLTITSEEKITQQTIINMEHNLEQAISSILPDEQRSPTTIQQEDILEQAASSILLDEQETPINIKEESPHLTTSLVPEVNPSPSHSDSQYQQSSSHTYVYSTRKPAVTKKRYR